MLQIQQIEYALVPDLYCGGQSLYNLIDGVLAKFYPLL